MKIGVFGGSFNPPHKMHKAIVKSLIKKGYFDKIIIVPTADNYNKSNLLEGVNRYEMLRQLFKKDDNIEVSSYEVEGRLYTLNTLNYFSKKYKNADLYFICGTDNLAYFETWYKYEEILKKYKLLVIPREGDNFEEVITKFKKYGKRIIKADIKEKTISSTMIRNEIVKHGYTKRLREYLYVDTINYLKKIDARNFWR